MEMPKDWEEATNVYRTRFYIVEQVMSVKDDDVESAELCSHDTFYRRTKKRDIEYEKRYGSRKQINGKRLPATMCSRKYVN
ncbi:MAG: hypothetical protein NC548_35520 [Lachnospiraceae bacterium]|nr:hypothetical protein [Lachnospiraceae bacterium]